MTAKTKTMEITLRVTVSDLDKGDRKAAAKDCGIPLRELPGIEDVTDEQISDMIAVAIANEDFQSELFAGSDMFVRFTEVDIVSATSTAAENGGAGADATATPAGWKLVPIEPTPEQYVRIVGGGITCEQAKAFYRAMIELPPPAPALSTAAEG